MSVSAPAATAPRPVQPSLADRWHSATAEALRAPAWVRLMPALLLGIDLVLEVAVPGAMAAGFLLTVLPVVVAFSLGPVAVGAVTAFTVVLQGLLSLRADHLLEQHHLWTYLATALAGAMGAGLAWQRRRQARDLARVRTVADTLQHAVLRPVPTRTGGLRAAARYRPAQADSAVGGDLYEVCETRFGTRVLLGDVRGKGLEAVRTVADVIGAFRNAAHETPDLAELARQLDRHVRREAAERHDEELFVTAVLAQHGPDGWVDLVNRGHLPPLLLRPGTVRPVDCAEQPPLGLGYLAVGADRPTTLRLHPGETLLLHTDGVSEARDTAGDFYPLDTRLARLPGTDPESVVDFLDRDVRRYAGTLADDLAVLALSPTG
ncbi:PP2C family protein-serine/threonine phosphatase [Kitasatospora sp. NPDC048365]|uniref:PP2C family protein-serine/threonine phosphatase n=1 Tax=Kitasatospora sp. NPDC048365 TaxID=3364050 RepID=UPI0037168B90